MEVFRNNPNKRWKNIIEKLNKTNTGNPSRLESIKLSLEKEKKIHDSDKNYLDSQFQQLEKLQDQNTLSDNKNKNVDNEKFIDIIKRLNQTELGDFSRLESIKLYLMSGKELLVEDGYYLKEQYDKLQKLEKNEPLGFQKPLYSKDSSQPQTILIDDVEVEPTKDFQSLGLTISNIIKESIPHFTIGIYGEWGTGKTTLMKAIERNLQDESVYDNEQKILSVWFNAWQYEREENPATLSLMKTVAYAMADHEKFGLVSKTILKSLTIVGKDLLEQISLHVLSKLDTNLDEELDKKIDYLNKLYKDSVYFDGLKEIRKQMHKLREVEGNDYRVVVFIDDLDRCTPRKALEVLESIKLFLDMEGIVFVIGLSHNTVIQLITNAYKATGVKGEDYIKKIIQIPIKIPSWSQENIIDLIENKISKNLHLEYSQFLSENAGMVAKVVDYNPRQLKRFINNVIIAFETFLSKNNSQSIQFNEIFLAKVLKEEWPDFYQELSTNKYFHKTIQWMISKPKELRKYFKYIKEPTDEELVEQQNKRISLLNTLIYRTNGAITTKHIDILSDFDFDTWLFLEQVKDVLFGIEDWLLVDRVMDVVEEFSYEMPFGLNKSKKSQSKS